MSIYHVPILISAILCTLLSVTTWLFRRRERINRIFSLFTLALALDAYAFFTWYQFGSIEFIHTWMRIIFVVGFFVPTGLILFFIAFTGFDSKMDEKVYGIQIKHFLFVSLSFIFVCMILAQFTNLIMHIPQNPENVWDVSFGVIGKLMFPLWALIFIYLFTMAAKGYKKTDSKPQKHFILLLTVGTGMWLLFGYGGATFLPISSLAWQAVSYSGTALMALFYSVAIVNYQSDKVHDLNINLEHRIKKRTEELSEKNTKLKEILAELKQVQQQIIVQEKMTILGQVAAGFTHEINTPVGAIHSMISTRLRAFQKLETALDEISPEIMGKDLEVRKMINVITRTDSLIDQSAERLQEITNTLKNFVKLDEAEKQIADIHQGIDSAITLIKHELLTNIKIVKNYGDIPPFLCHPQKLNQAFLNLLINACECIEGAGQIKIATKLNGDTVHISISDTGKGVKAEDFVSIFDPGFISKSSVIRANLGLSLSYQIVQDHGGSIDVASKPGKGSVFTIKIPLKK